MISIINNFFSSPEEILGLIKSKGIRPLISTRSQEELTMNYINPGPFGQLSPPQGPRRSPLGLP
jgi:hypothetical protein